MEVFHPLMIRSYTRKYDMDEPPKLEEPLDELDHRMRRIKDYVIDEQLMEEKFYRLVISLVLIKMAEGKILTNFDLKYDFLSM